MIATLGRLVFVGAMGAAAASAAGPFTLRVNADPKSDAPYRSIQEAVDSLPADNSQRVVIEIADGVYNERVRVDHNRVTLRGESRQGTRLAFCFPRSEYDRRGDRIGPGVLNLFGVDQVVENLTIENTQTSREHAFAIYGQPDRLVVVNCDVLGEGGDTVSLWNTAFGRYYHRGCRFRGGVDFLCPRGWCFVRDCEFECPTTAAAIWHDGHLDLEMKFVLQGCRFDGVQDFWIGRNHYPSQFYLLDCEFGGNLADKPILVVQDPADGSDRSLWERKYFHNCHREGGDYEWMRDNLAEADGAPRPEDVTPRWTFRGEWDPEGEAPPSVAGVETSGDEVHIYFTEAIGGAGACSVGRADGSVAGYASGDGTRRLVFRGGKAASRPTRLFVAGSGAAYGTMATLKTRALTGQALPASKPRRVLTLALVGDSTVADYPIDSPSQGWGHAAPEMFDDRVRIRNFARGGRSSKSFRAEGHWRAVLSAKPNFVLIQFGHNDNPGKGPERQTDPSAGGDFRENLRAYVAEARAIGATPILVTPPTRRVYAEGGRIRSDEGNLPYAEATIAVASEVGAPLVDLNRLTRELFERLGESTSDWIQPTGDRTHFTPSGARRIASLVVGELARVAPELAPPVLPDALRRQH